MRRDTQAKQRELKAAGYFCGARDPLLNTAHKGRFMVTLADLSDYELPTESACNGPECIVGDNLERLICDAWNCWIEDLRDTV